jgi:hypothetical protein
MLLAVFPPHSTHTLQPLDVVCFKPLSSNYSAKLTNHLFKTQGLLAVQKGDFFPLFWGAWESTFTTRLVLRAFEATGIAPMKADVILERFRKQDDNESEARPSTPFPKDWRQMNRLVRAAVKDTSAETSQKLGVEWVKQFNRHTASRTRGVYRLLILDGHSSHATPEFDRFCTENKIITLCMPAHTSHLLQPLDVSCFSPLKRAYSHEIQELARQGVYHVDKTDFLTVYTQIRPAIFTQQNIQAGFQATGLIPPCPNRVLSDTGSS